MDDTSLSAQALAALAKTELKDNLLTITPFVGCQQLAAIMEGTKGEESQFFLEKIQSLAQTIRSMPQTGQTDGQGDKAVAHLRYFWGRSAEALITEKDKGDTNDATPGQHQAFGSQDIGYGHELVYISIAEIIASGAVEMDLYFEPKTLAEHFSPSNAATSSPAREETPS